LQNGVVDAYTHVLEQYLTYPHEVLQDRIAESLQTLIQVGQVVENPKDYALASNFMWSCGAEGLIKRSSIRLGYTYDWS
jgi:NADP-dependent alcohol dehydrogenase